VPPVPPSSSPQPQATGRFGHYPSAAKNLLQRRVKDVPALPQVVYHVLSLFGQTETSTAQIAKIISLDPGLTARVLRMVNSSAYGFQRQITSIQHAIALLGFDAVQGLVLSASICKLFQAFTPHPTTPSQHKQGGTHPQHPTVNPTTTHGLDVHDFWHHSLLVALLAKKIAHLYNLPNEEEIFSAAIIHDIGYLIMHHYTPELDINLARNLRQAHITYDTEEALAAESRLLGFNHAELGQELAAKWKLPQMMADVMTFHHTPEHVSEDNAAVYCIALADYITSFHPQDSHSIAVKSQQCHQLFKHLNPVVAGYFSLETAEELKILLVHEQELLEEAHALQRIFDTEADDTLTD
jgi:putative nucleotidyltransferase with HDIG domain